MKKLFEANHRYRWPVLLFQKTVNAADTAYSKKKKVTELIVSGWLNVYWGVRMDLPALTNWVFPFEVNEVKFFSSEIFFVFSVWKKLKKNSVWFKKVCKYERKVR